MAQFSFKLDRPRPFFAELPYYLWGQVNYDSEGDCKKPTDRHWTRMYLKHRGTLEVIDIEQEAALCYAIQRLSGEPARSGREWVHWYEGDQFSMGAKGRYPEPDYEAWLAELKAEFGGPS